MVQYFIFSVLLAALAAGCSIMTGGWKRNIQNDSVENRLKNIKTKMFFAVFISMALVLYWILWGLMPTLSLETYSLASWLWFSGVVGFGLNVVFIEMYNDSVLYDEVKYSKFRFIPLSVSLLFFVYAFLASCSMISNNASRLQQILEVEVMRSDSISANDIAPVDIEHMISVDADLAKKIAETKLGQMPALGSRVYVGEMSIQNLTGEFTIKDGEEKIHHLKFENEQVWVAPLEHSDFWKWNKFGTTPGYMIVSAIDRQKAYFVNHLDGRDVQLRYLKSAYFGDNIKRFVRKRGYVGKILASADFELDNNGRPHMIYTMLEPTVGLRGYVPCGAVIVDAQTGDLRKYAMADVPDWVDIIVPQDIVENTIDWWGEYGKGYWNACFSKEGVQLATPGTTNLYNGGRTYWYTGVQSAGADNSTSGFMMVDSRTMKAKLYPKAGITENEARRIAMGQPGVKEANYFATFPVPYNVKGIFSYFMTMKDSTSGEIMAYAFVSVENREVVGTGKSKIEAERNYINCAMRVSNDMLKDGYVVQETETYVIRSIVNEGSTYFICFKGVEGIEFTGSSEFFRELRHARNGHKVEVSFDKGKSDLVRITYFKNLSFKI